MDSTLSGELYWLTLTVLMTSLFWVPYIVNRMLERGVFTALWDPQGVTDTNRNWASRMMRAHKNAVENLVIFAPLVICVELMKLNSSVTAGACIVYFFARLTHYVTFTLGVPLLRVVAFLVGFAAQFTLALTLLGI